MCGCGYVDFALRWPQHFLVMFDLPVDKSGDFPAGDPLPLALTAWSLVHGIAKLAISGNLPLNARSTIEFTRSATQALCGGMAAGKSSAGRR